MAAGPKPKRKPSSRARAIERILKRADRRLGVSQLAKEAVAGLDPRQTISDVAWTLQNPVARVKGEGRAAEGTMAFPGSGAGASAASLIPVTRWSPKHLIDTRDYGHDARANAQDLADFADDPFQFVASQRGMDPDDIVHGGYGYDAEALVPNALRELSRYELDALRRMADKTSQRIAKGLDDPAHELATPAEMSPEQFLASPFAVFHSTHSRPGLGHASEGIHVGSAASAIERAVVGARGYTRAEKFRMRAGAMKAPPHRVLDEVTEDTGSWSHLFPHGFDRQYTRMLRDPRQMARHRSGVRPYVDDGWQTKKANVGKSVVPYENKYEGPGTVSFLISTPTALRTHRDLVTDFAAAKGRIPDGAVGYRRRRVFDAKVQQAHRKMMLAEKKIEPGPHAPRHQSHLRGERAAAEADAKRVLQQKLVEYKMKKQPLRVSSPSRVSAGARGGV